MESFIVDEALVKGLRDDKRSPRNLALLTKATNMRATQWRGVPPETVTYPITDLDLDDILSWPYPALWRGKSKTLLACDTDIYLVTESDWTAGTALTFYRLGDPQTESLTNGTFTGGTTGWTATGWTYGTNNIKHDTGNTTSLSQAAVLQTGHLYRVRFTVSGMTAGTLTPYCGTGGAGTAISQDGTYCQDIMCTTTTAFLLTPTTGFDGTVDNVSVKEVKSGTIPAGTQPWQFADFQDIWFATNGSCIVAHLHLYGRWTYFVFETEAGTYPIKCTSLCNFNSRLLIGGITSPTSYFSDADWLDLWQTWIEHSPNDITTYRDFVMGSNIIMYSTPRGGDYWDPFLHELAILGMPGQTEVDLLKPYYIDLIKQGSIGFIPMPWQGSIYAMRQLGDVVATYGANGVTAVVPQSADGMAAYRTVQLAEVGVASSGAVGGDLVQHCMVDNTGIVRTITADLNVNRRGYSEWISSLTDADIIVAHDPDQRDFIISDGTKGYILSQTGLGEAVVMPTMLNFVDDGLIGAYTPATAATTNFELITDSFDMGLRGIKTIKNVEIAAEDVTNLKVCIDYKNSRSSTAWMRSLEILATNEGFAFPIVSGTDFRLRITGTWGTNGKLEYATVRWTAADKRAMGGQVGKSA